MADQRLQGLSRRERQIIEIVYGLGRATAAEVHERLPEPPSYSAVRALLRILEEKGHLEHQADGPRYVYLPTLPRTAASQSALKQLVSTFFDGSTTQAVAALLDMSATRMSDEELEELSRRIDQARKEGR